VGDGIESDIALESGSDPASYVAFASERDPLVAARHGTMERGFENDVVRTYLVEQFCLLLAG
jgi:hypothetical protein